MTVLGMDIVRGLSGFCGSGVFCEPAGSDLNNFCCMLRTLVAMTLRGKREGGVPNAHLFPSKFYPTPSRFHSSLRFDDVVGGSSINFRQITGPGRPSTQTLVWIDPGMKHE